MTLAGWRWLAHPFLAGVYFVLTLAASNAMSLTGWRDLAWPVPTMLAVAAVAWALALGLSRDPQKASLISLLWIVAFSVFGYVAEALLPTGTLQLVGGELGLLVLFLLALIGPTLAIRRTRRPLQAFNRYATLVTGILVAYTCVQLYSGMHQERRLRHLVPLPSSTGEGMAASAPPDIYLIILDKYTAGEVLRQHFGYDNRGFEESLRSRGFVVPRHGRANYPQTQLALAAMLNFDYVQKLPRQVHLFDLIEDNRLAAFLKQRGYRFVFFPTGFKFTSRNRQADLQLPEPTEVKGEFGGVWQRTTMMPELFRVGCGVLGCRAGRLVYVAEGPDLIDWKFQQLQGLSGGPTPTFALAHLSLPHEPYLYRADCAHRDPYFPMGSGVIGNDEEAKAYLEQIGCANRKVLQLVDSIMARSRVPPVILLQSDHGHGRFGRYLPKFGEVDAYRGRERMSVFSAYLLPGVDRRLVGDSITPVNAVRLVLRSYFGADLPPLEDASYWATEPHPLDLDRVTSW
ncbi:MAG TPA: hypothetical protein VIQ27_19515 [Gemmatimonadales bacterium]